jgi:osmotically-inducible protein OsmY
MVVYSGDIPDKRIAHSIAQALERYANVDPNSIELTIPHGIVNLSGILPNWINSRAAYETVLHTEDILDIRDKLIVEPAW